MEDDSAIPTRSYRIRRYPVLLVARIYGMDMGWTALR
jgi:hypothetical protein